MNEIKYYYRLKPISIDNWDVKDVESNNQVVINFDVLNEAFELLKTAYETKSNERAQITVCVMPESSFVLGNVIEISVYHRIKMNLFSKKIKENDYTIFLAKGSPNGVIGYDYKTNDFNEVKHIFYNYVVDQEIPDLSKWNVIHS